MSNLWGCFARDAPYSPPHRHIAPLCRGNSRGVSVRDACDDRSVRVVRCGRHRWHGSGVCAFSVCGKLGHQCKPAGLLRERQTDRQRTCERKKNDTLHYININSLIISILDLFNVCNFSTLK